MMALSVLTSPVLLEAAAVQAMRSLWMLLLATASQRSEEVAMLAVAGVAFAARAGVSWE
jgi:hypothetical protein